MAYRAFLRVNAVCRRAGLMTERRRHFHVTHGAMLTLGAVCRLSGRMTLCGDGFLLDQRFLAERAMLTFRQTLLRACRTYGAVGDDDMITAVLFLRDHINAEMVRCKRNFTVGYFRRHFFRRIAAHVIYDRAFRGNAARQRQGYGDIAFHVDLASVAPKLHVVKMIAVLLDGEHADRGFHQVVCGNLGNLEFCTKLKSAVYRFHGRVVLGVGKILDGGILHEIPCEKCTDTHERGDQKCDKADFQTFFGNRRAITSIFGDIPDCDFFCFCDFFRACECILGRLVIQMPVIVAENFCLHKQRTNAVVRLICAFVKQVREHFLCFVHLSHFKGIVDLVQLSFKYGMTARVFQSGIQTVGERGDQIDVFPMSLTSL